MSAQEYGIELLVPTQSEQIKIREFIEAVKQDNITQRSISNFSCFLNSINCDCIILGCTELPIIYDYAKDYINKEKKVFDPLEAAIADLKERRNGRLDEGN